MKTIKIKYLKPLISMSFVLLLAVGCGNAENKTTSVAGKTIVEKPESDIQTAVLTNNIEVVKQHIATGTDLNKKEAMTGSTPLITAATFGKVKIVKELINAGVDLTATNNDGATALHTSAFFCQVEIVQMLINANTDKSIRNNFGATAKESVMGPFDQIKPIYEMLQKQLEPMGLKIDLNHIEKTRPIIVKMLK